MRVTRRLGSRAAIIISSRLPLLLASSFLPLFHSLWSATSLSLFLLPARTIRRGSDAGGPSARAGSPAHHHRPRDSPTTHNTRRPGRGRAVSSSEQTFPLFLLHNLSDTVFVAEHFGAGFLNARNVSDLGVLMHCSSVKCITEVRRGEAVSSSNAVVSLYSGQSAEGRGGSYIVGFLL